MNEKRRMWLVRLGAAITTSLYKGLLYFLSFLGPVLILNHFRWLPIAVLLALAIIGFGAAGLVFLLLVVLTKKCLIGPLPSTGIQTIETPYARKWFFAAVLVALVDQSPFRSMVNGLSLFASWYYRGMGAKMPNSVLLGARTRMSDPYFVELGENVTIGADAVILGHLGHGREIILGRVFVGDGAIIGMRSVVLPDVRIGKDARVGAGALVARGTVIPDGESWAGVPARKISPRKEVREGRAAGA
jgi:acetyltransferase-like isoleucine patch superfamily enzyme